MKLLAGGIGVGIGRCDGTVGIRASGQCVLIRLWTVTQGWARDGCGAPAGRSSGKRLAKVPPDEIVGTDSIGATDQRTGAKCMASSSWNRPWRSQRQQRGDLRREVRDGDNVRRDSDSFHDGSGSDLSQSMDRWSGTILMDEEFGCSSSVSGCKMAEGAWHA